MKMTPTIIGIGFLAAKAGVFVLGSMGLIAGLQKHHDFKIEKKVQHKRKGGARNVNTSEDAIKEFEELRGL